MDGDAGKTPQTLVRDVGELALIERFIKPYAPDIGDDCAWIKSSGHDLLISTDALVEDVHFLRTSPAQWVGQKALRVNASDIAASGGKPKWVTLALSMPGDLPIDWLEAFMNGFADAMACYDIHLVGGDVTAAPKHLSIAITVFGRLGDFEDPLRTPEPTTRTGAKSGEWVCVTGYLGETYPGLQSLLGKEALSSDERFYWEKRHFFPPNRVAFGTECHRRGLASSMMDLSDGLFVDAERLAAASKVALHLDLQQLPLSKQFVALGLTDEDALHAGEDYELLLTVPEKHLVALKNIAAKTETPLQPIGRVRTGQGLRFFRGETPVKLSKKPWHHF